MRRIYIAALIILMPCAAYATTPPGQAVLDSSKVLRGHFVEEHRTTDGQKPFTTAGHFTAAPGQGLIWGIEQPMQTMTIITQNGMVQDIGGLAMKLPAKNLRHLYDMVGGALAGNWNAIEADYVMQISGDQSRWHVSLTPRPGVKSSYATITVDGARFVQAIALTKPDGTADVFSFSDASLTPMPPTRPEMKAFAEAGAR